MGVGKAKAPVGTNTQHDDNPKIQKTSAFILLSESFSSQYGHKFTQYHAVFFVLESRITLLELIYMFL